MARRRFFRYLKSLMRYLNQLKFLPNRPCSKDDSCCSGPPAMIYIKGLSQKKIRADQLGAGVFVDLDETSHSSSMSSFSERTTEPPSFKRCSTLALLLSLILAASKLLAAEAFSRNSMVAVDLFAHRSLEGTVCPTQSVYPALSNHTSISVDIIQP